MAVGVPDQPDLYILPDHWSTDVLRTAIMAVAARRKYGL
jgi:hypothetical protein